MIRLVAALLLCCPFALAQDPAHPIPLLPATYELVVEANIANGNYTVYQHDVYDGARSRTKTITHLGTATVTRINLVDADVVVHYHLEDPDATCVVGNSVDDFMTDESGRIYSSNEFLGETPYDVYQGPSTARGIRTEAWARTETGGSGGDGPPPGVSFTLTSEYAVDEWTLWGPSTATPVRATLEGVADSGARTFRHIYDFYQYRTDHDVDPEFSVPLRMSFDENDLDGACNATAIADDPAKRAAVLALPVVHVDATGFHVECPTTTSSSSKKKSASGLSDGAAAGLAVGAFVVGLVAGLLVVCVAQRGGKKQADGSAQGIGMTGGSTAGPGGEKNIL